MLSANLSGPFRGCLYYALLGLPQATGLAGGYDFPYVDLFEMKYQILSRISLAQSIWLGMLPCSSRTRQMSGVISSTTYIFPSSS